MRKTIKRVLLAGAMTGLAGLAMAEPVTPKQAQGYLFSDRMMIETADLSALAPEVQDQARAVLKDMSRTKQLKFLAAQGYGYYGAIAVPADREITLKSLTVVANFHNPEAAAAGALSTCAEATGLDNCTVIGTLLPRGYEPRALSLSQEATDRFENGWEKGDGPKYLAYSPATHAWVMAKGRGADAVALERCNTVATETGADADCLIAITED